MSIFIHKTQPIIVMGPVAKILTEPGTEVIVLYDGTEEYPFKVADGSEKLMQLSQRLNVVADGEKRRLNIVSDMLDELYVKVEVDWK